MIREKIKEIELNRVFKELKLYQKYLNQLIENYSKRIGFENIKNFNNELKKNNIKFETVKKKILLE